MLDQPAPVRRPQPGQPAQAPLKGPPSSTPGQSTNDPYQAAVDAARSNLNGPVLVSIGGKPYQFATGALALQAIDYAYGKAAAAPVLYRSPGGVITAEPSTAAGTERTSSGGNPSVNEVTVVNPGTGEVLGRFGTPQEAQQFMVDYELGQKTAGFERTSQGNNPYLASVTVSSGPQAGTHYFRTAPEAQAFIDMLSAPEPVGYNQFPQLGVVGTFLTGAFRTPEFLSRDVENLLSWGRSAPGKVILRYGPRGAELYVGALASVGAVGVGATALATGNISPAVKLAQQEPFLIPAEVLGAGFGVATVSKGFSSFEGVTGVAGLSKFGLIGKGAQAAIRFGVGGALGGSLSAAEGGNPVTGAWEGGAIYAASPLLARGSLGRVYADLRELLGYPNYSGPVPLAGVEIMEGPPQIDAFAPYESLGTRVISEPQDIFSFASDVSYLRPYRVGATSGFELPEIEGPFPVKEFLGGEPTPTGIGGTFEGEGAMAPDNLPKGGKLSFSAKPGEEAYPKVYQGPEEWMTETEAVGVKRPMSQLEGNYRAGEVFFKRGGPSGPGGSGLGGRGSAYEVETEYLRTPGEPGWGNLSLAEKGRLDVFERRPEFEVPDSGVNLSEVAGQGVTPRPAFKSAAGLKASTRAASIGKLAILSGTSSSLGLGTEVNTSEVTKVDVTSQSARAQQESSQLVLGQAAELKLLRAQASLLGSPEVGRFPARPSVPPFRPPALAKGRAGRRKGGGLVFGFRELKHPVADLLRDVTAPSLGLKMPRGKSRRKRR
jgi:hypothetical protein